MHMITSIKSVPSPFSSYAIRDTDLLLDAPSGSARDYILKIRDLPIVDKPRERLLHDGPAALSLRELLAIILTTGTSKEGVLEMSSRIIREYGEHTLISETDAARLSTDLDIPIVKACQIVAVGELGRRIYEKNPSGFTVIRNAKDVYDHLSDMRTLAKEQLRGLYLNSHNRIVHDEVISIGTINSNLVHPREVFRPAIEYSAAAVILAHNHPSGVVEPSDEDRRVTEQLVKAGKMIGIEVLDHVVIGKDSWKSINANY
jgi:DNA repair protein RadC